MTEDTLLLLPTGEPTSVLTNSKTVDGTKGRLAFLDWIRGLAALSVVLQHAAERLWPTFTAFSHQYFNIGKFGVAVFFLTSGFVIPLTLEKGRSLKSFWINRFFRLYPLYWLSLFLMIGLYFLRLHGALPADFQSSFLRNLLVNFTMLQEFFRIPHAVGLYYTLTLELVFYVIFSGLYWLDLHRQAALHAWVAIGAQAAVTVLLPLILNRRLPMAEVFFFTSFFIGTALYRLANNEISIRTVLALISVLGLVTLWGTHLNYDVYKKTNLEEQFDSVAVMMPWVLAYGLFVFSFANRAWSYPNMFTWMGEVSYSTYLLHPFFLAISALIASQSAAFCFVIVSTLVCSHFSFYYFEKPLIRFGKRLASKPAEILAHSAVATLPLT